MSFPLPPLAQIYRRRPQRKIGGARVVVLLTLAALNLVLCFAQPDYFVTTIIVGATCGYAGYFLITDKRWRIPPLLDLAFVFAAFFYSVVPGMFFIMYPGHRVAPTLALQQALVGTTVAIFQLCRHIQGWQSWVNVVSGDSTKSMIVLDWQFTSALVLTCLAWVAAALPGLASFMSMQYGTRFVNQRSDMTIPLLGFDLLAIVGTALLIKKLLASRHRRKWWLVGLLLFTAYGVLTLVINGARTNLVSCLMLPFVSILAVRKLTLKMMLIAGIGVLALFPVFDLIGRARSGDIGDLQTIASVRVDNDFESLVENTEMIGVVPIADQMIDRLGGERLWGKYIGWSLVQSPPAFMLRPLGLDESRSLARLYIETYDTAAWEMGGGWGLPLPAEAYCNFGELGGVFSGIVLFLFVMFYERALLSRLPFPLAIALSAQFMIAVARVNRGGLESLAKPMAVAFVMLVVIKMCQILTAGSRQRAQRQRAS